MLKLLNSEKIIEEASEYCKLLSDTKQKELKRVFMQWEGFVEKCGSDESLPVSLWRYSSSEVTEGIFKTS